MSQIFPCSPQGGKISIVKPHQLHGQNYTGIYNNHTFSITCALSVWVTVGVGVHTGGVTNITVLGTCTVSRRTWVELQVGTRNTGSIHSPVTILHVCVQI